MDSNICIVFSCAGKWTFNFKNMNKMSGREFYFSLWNNVIKHSIYICIKPKMEHQTQSTVTLSYICLHWTEVAHFIYLFIYTYFVFFKYFFFGKLTKHIQKLIVFFLSFFIEKQRITFHKKHEIGVMLDDCL